MGRDEQQEEREVLESIFPDEITYLSDTEFRISIKLDIADGDEGADSAPVMVLSVRYPDDYPDKAPYLDLSAPTADPGTAPHDFFSVADKAELLAGLDSIIEENMGMAMIFQIVTTVKENAEQLVVSRRQAAARVHEEAILAAEREENRKFQGTPVTRESFIKWRDGFLREMEEQRQREDDEKLADMKKSRIKEPVRLTGRQLWERGLAGKGDQDEEDVDGRTEADDLAAQMTKLNA